MPRAWSRRRRITVTGDVALVAAAETVIATLPGISTPAADTRIDLDGFAQITGLAGTTSITLRVRRDGVAGTLVGEGNPITPVAANTVTAGINVQDNPAGDLASQVYVLTATAVGANATALQSELAAAY